MAQQLQPISHSQENVHEFSRKLVEFHKSLPEREQQALTAMMVVAGGQVETVNEAQEGDDVQGYAQPTVEEVDSFQEKVRQFHDSLPEGQHELFDDLVRLYYDKVENDVQGHYHIIDQGWVYTGRLNSYAVACHGWGGQAYETYRGWYYGYDGWHQWSYVVCDRTPSPFIMVG